MAPFSRVEASSKPVALQYSQREFFLIVDGIDLRASRDGAFIATTIRNRMRCVAREETRPALQIHD